MGIVSKPPVETTEPALVPPADPSTSADPLTISAVILAVIGTVFALHWAQHVFIPLVLGIIISYLLNPLVVRLERLNIPRVAATTVVMLTLLGIGVLGTLALRGQVQGILDQVPDAAERLSTVIREMAAEPSTVQKVQAAARELEQATTQATDGAPAPRKPATRVVVEHSRFKLVDLLWTGSLGVFGIIGETAMLLLLVFFLLVSGDRFKRKLLRVTGPSLSKKRITVNILDDINRSIQNYMLTMLLANILLAGLTWAVFRWIGLDNAGAWAIAAGALHFIPYLGPVITALATGMAGFMQFGTFTMALVVSGSSLVLATFVGMVVVTWMCGKITNMNATVVFVSLLFWGWLWGIWGVLLAIPIMGMVKVCCEHVADLQPVADLLAE